MSTTPTPAPTPRTTIQQLKHHLEYMGLTGGTMAGLVDQLERELAAKDAEIARLTAVGPVSGASESDVYQWLRDAQARVTELERQLAEAGEDKARQWDRGYYCAVAMLLKMSCREGCDGGPEVTELFRSGGNWKHADPEDIETFRRHNVIDAARARKEGV